jgi:hypothetical protein
VKEELTAWAEFQDEVELGLALECESQLNDKRMLNVLLHTKVLVMTVNCVMCSYSPETYEYGPLGDGVLDLILLNEVLLLERLDGIYVPRIPLLAQDDLAI